MLKPSGSENFELPDRKMRQKLKVSARLVKY